MEENKATNDEGKTNVVDIADVRAAQDSIQVLRGNLRVTVIDALNTIFSKPNPDNKVLDGEKVLSMVEDAVIMKYSRQVAVAATNTVGGVIDRVLDKVFDKTIK